MAGSISIQRGETTVGNNGTTDTTFTAVSALTAAFELNTCNQRTFAGSTTSAGNHEADDMSGRLELTAVGTLTFTRIAGSQNIPMGASWEIWEYVGDPGGDNEFIVRSRNTVSLSTYGEVTQSLDTTPTSADKCIPFITGISNETVTNGEDHITATAYINDSGSLAVSRGGSDGAGTTVVQVVTVEFTGSNWSVGHGRVTGNSADTGTITLNTSGDGAGGSTFNVSSWDEAFIHGSLHIEDTTESIAANSTVFTDGTLTSEVDWTSNSNSAGSKTFCVHVLNHADMAVTRYTDTSSTQGYTNIDITSAGLTSLSEASVVGYSTTSGTGDAMGRGWRNYDLSSLTNARHWCHRSGNTMAHNLQVIDVSGVVEAAGLGITATPISSGSSVTAVSSVLPGAVGITASPLSGGSSVTAPGSVLPGEVGITATAIASGSSITTPSLASVSPINPSPIASGSGLTEPTLSVGAVDISATPISSGSSVTTPTVAASGGVQDISPTPIASGSSATDVTFGLAYCLLDEVEIEILDEAGVCIEMEYGPSISPAPITSTISFSTPSLSTPPKIFPDPIVGSTFVTGPVLSAGAVDISPTPISSGSSVTTPSVAVGAGSAQDISPSPIASESSATDATFALTYCLLNENGEEILNENGVCIQIEHGLTVNPGGIASTASIPTPTVLTPPKIFAVPLTQSPTITEPTLSAGPVDITVTPIGSTTNIPAPTLIVGGTIVSVTPIGSTSAVGSPTLSVGAVDVSPTSISSGSTIATPTLTTGASLIEPSPIGSGSSVGTPLLSAGAVDITATPISSGSSVGTPTLSVSSIIAPTPIPSGSGLTIPTLSTGASVINVSPIASGAAFTTPVVTARIFYAPFVTGARRHGRDASREPWIGQKPGDKLWRSVRISESFLAFYLVEGVWYSTKYLIPANAERVLGGGRLTECTLNDLDDLLSANLITQDQYDEVTA